MNLNLFDDVDGLILRERENSLVNNRNNNNNNNRPSGFNGETPRFPQQTPLAMAYVPFQQWGKVYNSDQAFNSGTLFPELDLPFERGGDSK